MLNKLYELNCLLSPDFSEEQAVAFAQKIEANLPESKIIKSEIPKKIGLSYLIKKQNAAFLYSVVLETEPQKMEKIKNILEKEDKILRFLLLNKKQIQESPIFNVIERPAIKEEASAIQNNELETKISAKEQPAPNEPVKKAKKEKAEKKTTRKKKAGGEEIKADLKQIGEDLDKILDQ